MSHPTPDRPAPFSFFFDLGGLPDAGAEITLSPGTAERAAISHWLGIEAIDQLKATIRLSRVGGNEYSYAGSFAADVVQACVVTLEPVASRLAGEFHRLFKVKPRPNAGRRRGGAEAVGSVELSSLEEDEPELIDSASIDLAAPLLEEISLALDPYPRAPGVAFEGPKEEKSSADNPFAVLERLKPGDTGKGSLPGAKKRS